MNSQVLTAAAFRGLKPRLFDSVIPLQLVESIKEQYNFREVQNQWPETLGFTYGESRGGDSIIVIEQLVIHHVGTRATSVGASTRTSTDDADLFLDNFLAWAKEKHKIDTLSELPPAYHSRLEFVLKKPLSSRFDDLRNLGKAITNLVKGYGSRDCPEFELGGFSMHFDTTKDSLLPTPRPFAIERRVGADYGENRYYSEAPLRTEDHKAVLEQLEQML
jgi:hypothetical protein